MTGDGVNVRSGPGVGYGILGVVNKGAMLELSGEDGGVDGRAVWRAEGLHQQRLRHADQRRREFLTYKVVRWLNLDSVGNWLQGAGGMLLGLAGGWDALVKVLVVCMAVDYATGVINAIRERKLSSKVGLRGHPSEARHLRCG